MKTKKFFHQDGYPADKLTLKDGESLEAGVKRLSAQGWVIPTNIEQRGKYIHIK